MLIHQVKVLQSVAASIIEGGRGVTGTAFPKQPENRLNSMSLKDRPFSTCSRSSYLIKSGC